MTRPKYGTKPDENHRIVIDAFKNLNLDVKPILDKDSKHLSGYYKCWYPKYLAWITIIDTQNLGGLWADWLILFMNGYCLYVEVKMPGKKLTPGEEIARRILPSWCLVHSEDEFMDELNSFIDARYPG